MTTRFLEDEGFNLEGNRVCDTCCYNPESAGSQAPGPDVCTRRRRSDIPCRGGQYVLTVASRHYVACEHWELERVVTLRLAYCIYAQA